MTEPTSPEKSVPEKSDFDPKSMLRGLGIAEKARGALEGAAESAAALKGRTAAALSGLGEQASRRVQDAIDAGMEQITGVAADLNAALPVISQAGYTLHSVTLSASLSPSVVAAFHVAAAVTDEQVAAVEAAHPDSALALTIIRTLRRASKLQEGLAFGALKPRELSISLGLSPSVSVRFG
jgi:hypothetical protein